MAEFLFHQFYKKQFRQLLILIKGLKEFSQNLLNAFNQQNVNDVTSNVIKSKNLLKEQKGSSYCHFLIQEQKFIWLQVTMIETFLSLIGPLMEDDPST